MGEPHDTFIYSATNDINARVPFHVVGDMRAGDAVWVATTGEGGHVSQVVGVWRTEAEADAGMQVKVDAYKARQHDDMEGFSYDLAAFPIGAPWKNDESFWLFEAIVE